MGFYTTPDWYAVIFPRWVHSRGSAQDLRCWLHWFPLPRGPKDLQWLAVSLHSLPLELCYAKVAYNLTCMVSSETIVVYMGIFQHPNPSFICDVFLKFIFLKHSLPLTNILMSFFTLKYVPLTVNEKLI